ncbi:hypothetical protein C8J57DRAFT_1644698 [Mycena rebaudengoi]|nr:hypothetical protein C8J57DRAFT_1644698 [Mycena rebaudengoi]
MSTTSPLVDVFLQALKECKVNAKSRTSMKESMKTFLSSEKEKKNFERLVNAARRHLGTNPRAFRTLNVVLATMDCRVVVRPDAEVSPATLFVVHTSNEAFVLPAVPPVQFPGTPVHNLLVRSALQSTALDAKLPAELLDPPAPWADAIMELLLFEIDYFTTLYELGQVDESYRQRCARCLRRLSRMSSRLPPSFYIVDAVKEGQTSVNFGGFSDIWMGRLDNAKVCIKVLRYYTSATDAERGHLLKESLRSTIFHREALYWGRLNHPNVLSFLGVSQTLFDPYPSFCLVSPWMDNGCLTDFLGRNPDSDLLKALIETAEGMRYLHELDPPIVHADIRGANILVTRDHRCCLADFGLAAATEMTVTSARNAGAVRWMAPETLRETPVGTSPSPTRDIFAFGRTVLEVIAGETPPRPQSSRQEITDAIWAMMNSCWESDPEKRPPARQLLRELGIPPPPDYIILRRPGPQLTVGDLRSKLQFDKEYLVQILPTKDEHPTAELIETISAELRAIQTHLDFDVNGRSHPEFDLITALTSNIRKPIPRLINPADPGVSPKLLHAKYSSDQNYLHRLISLGEHTPRQAFIDAVKKELHTIASCLAPPKTNNSNSQPAHGFNHNNSSMQGGFENPSPLQVTVNRWDRKSVQAVDPDSPEIVDRKVKGLLNKLTMEKFDSISDQIIEWVNRSEKENDGRTLLQVIRLVFEKATDEATWSEIYARLCRKMMEQISPKVQDDGIKNAEGKPITGGQLFRKYLLNRCQEDFERGWVAKEATAAAAATKAMEDKAAKAANEKSSDADVSGEPGDEIVLYSDEYYTAQKSKRQGLGLMKFIGELFKLQMLTERIMHECVKKLLGNVENPEEEEIESLCKLISTVGLLLDTPKARAHMDVYFSRMKELTKSNNVSSRMQFVLQDVIELRDRKWISRVLVAAPSTIAAAAKEKASQEKETFQHQISMSRGGSRRGGDRGGDFQGPGPEGWNVAGGNTPWPPPKASDVSNFGKIQSTRKGLPMTFGPSSVFSGKKDSKRESLSRSSSNQNMFSMLSQNTEAPAEAKAAEAPPQRRRLILQPRSKPTADEPGTVTPDTTPAGSDNGSEDDEEETPAGMTEEEATKKIGEDAREFFAIRNLEEADIYFSALPAVHHHRLVEKLVSVAVESKETNAQLVADFFAQVVSKEQCSAEAFEEGFSPLVEILEDIAIDALKAPNMMALMMKSVSFDSERTARIAAKSSDADKLLALLS